MEAVLWFAGAASCLLGAMAVGIMVATPVPGADGFARFGARVGGMVPLLVRACERVGHMPWVIRVQRLGPVAGMGDRLSKLRPFAQAGASRGAVLVACGMALLAAGVTCSLVAGSLLGFPVGIALGSWGLMGALGSHEEAERARLREQVPQVLRALATSMAAGRTLAQSIAHVGDSVGDPMGGMFAAAAMRIRTGEPAEEVVEHLCSGIDMPGMALVGTALRVSARTGSSLSGLLDRTGHMVQAEVAQHRELMARTSQARLSAKIVAALPVIMIVLLVLLSPDYRVGLTTGSGMACVFVAALMDVAALVIIKGVLARSLR